MHQVEVNILILHHILLFLFTRKCVAARGVNSQLDFESWRVKSKFKTIHNWSETIVGKITKCTCSSQTLFSEKKLLSFSKPYLLTREANGLLTSIPADLFASVTISFTLFRHSSRPINCWKCLIFMHKMKLNLNSVVKQKIGSRKAILSGSAACNNRCIRLNLKCQLDKTK